MLAAVRHQLHHQLESCVTCEHSVLHIRLELHDGARRQRPDASTFDRDLAIPLDDGDHHLGRVAVRRELLPRLKVDRELAAIGCDDKAGDHWAIGDRLLGVHRERHEYSSSEGRGSIAPAPGPPP